MSEQEREVLRQVIQKIYDGMKQRNFIPVDQLVHLEFIRATLYDAGWSLHVVGDRVTLIPLEGQPV